MTLFDEIEPTRRAVEKIKSLPADQPLCIVSLLRLRTDLADGRAEAAWEQWQRGIQPVLREYGVEQLMLGEMLFDMVGAGGWDHVGVYRYPNPIVFWRFMSDERVVDLLRVRRGAAEDVNMLVLRPVSFADPAP
jgi:hypothetical protein